MIPARTSDDLPEPDPPAHHDEAVLSQPIDDPPHVTIAAAEIPRISSLKRPHARKWAVAVQGIILEIDHAHSHALRDRTAARHLMRFVKEPIKPIKKFFLRRRLFFGSFCIVNTIDGGIIRS